MCVYVFSQSEPVDIFTSGNEAYELVKGQTSRAATQPPTTTEREDEYVVPSLLPPVGDDGGAQKPPKSIAAVCATEYEHIN